MQRLRFRYPVCLEKFTAEALPRDFGRAIAACFTADLLAVDIGHFDACLSTKGPDGLQLLRKQLIRMV